MLRIAGLFAPAASLVVVAALLGCGGGDEVDTTDEPVEEPATSLAEEPEGSTGDGVTDSPPAAEAEQADAVCQAAMDELESLPGAAESPGELAAIQIAVNEVMYAAADELGSLGADSLASAVSGYAEAGTSFAAAMESGTDEDVAAASAELDEAGTQIEGAALDLGALTCAELAGQ